MRVITQRVLLQKASKNPELLGFIQNWLHAVKKMNVSSPGELKDKYFPKASILKSGRVVFDIGSNYRLIVKVEFEKKLIFIKFFGSHSEYDKINANNIQFKKD